MKIYGGDLELSTSIFESMTNQLSSELTDISTQYQKQAVIIEWLQTLAKIVSLLIEQNEILAGSWRDLPSDEKRWIIMKKLANT